MDKELKYNDLTFFTNEANNTLLDWFKTILKTVEFFDIPVDIYDKYLEKVRKLLEEGGMAKKTAKTIFNKLKGETNLMKILAVLKKKYTRLTF